MKDLKFSHFAQSFTSSAKEEAHNRVAPTNTGDPPERLYVKYDKIKREVGNINAHLYKNLLNKDGSLPSGAGDGSAIVDECIVRAATRPLVLPCLLCNPPPHECW